MKNAVRSILIILLEIVIIAGLIFACIQIFPSSDSKEGREAAEAIEQEVAEEEAEELGVDTEESAEEEASGEESLSSDESASGDESADTEAAKTDAE